MLGDPYLAAERRYDQQCAESDAYNSFIEEFDYAELLAGIDDLGELALAVINEDLVELKKWKAWIDTQVEKQYNERIERAKEDAAEAQFDAYISSMEDCF